MLSVHVAPSATANGTLEVYGAPPLSVVPSEQLRLQTTSSGYVPPEQVIAEEMVAGHAAASGNVPVSTLVASPIAPPNQVSIDDAIDSTVASEAMPMSSFRVAPKVQD